PWVYWGYRPAPRPANVEPWEATDAIAQAFDRLLAEPDRNVTILRRMQREKIPAQPNTLARWLQDERQPEAVAAILASLRDHPPEQTRAALAKLIATPDHAVTNRAAALNLYAAGLDQKSEPGFLALAKSIEDGPVLAETLRDLAKRPSLDSSSLLMAKAQS